MCLNEWIYIFFLHDIQRTEHIYIIIQKQVTIIHYDRYKVSLISWESHAVV